MSCESRTCVEIRCPLLGKVADRLGGDYYPGRSHFGDSVAPPILQILPHLFVLLVRSVVREHVPNLDLLHRSCVHAHHHLNFSRFTSRQWPTRWKRMQLFFAELAIVNEGYSLGYIPFHSIHILYEG